MRISDWSSDVCSSDLQERLAELFIKNTPEKNHADPRLSPAQAIVDAAMKTAADRGESARMVATIRESTRQLVADRIKAGGSLDGEIGRAAQVQAPAPRDKDRSRSEEHTSELQSLMRNAYAGLCLKTKTTKQSAI